MKNLSVDIRNLFRITSWKVFAFVLVVVLMHINTHYGLCIDPVYGDEEKSGWCELSYGEPFRSIILRNEISIDIIGLIGNLIVAYLIVSLLFFAFAKIKERYA